MPAGRLGLAARGSFGFPEGELGAVGVVFGDVEGVGGEVGEGVVEGELDDLAAAAGGEVGEGGVKVARPRRATRREVAPVLKVARRMRGAWVVARLRVSRRRTVCTWSR